MCTSIAINREENKKFSLAWSSWSTHPNVFYSSGQHSIRLSVLCRERLEEVVDLKRGYRNSLNERKP